MNSISRMVALGVVVLSSLVWADGPKGNAQAGKTLFQQNCVVCHGPEGKGDGPGAAGLNPKPANFADAARRDFSEDKQVRIVTNGGPSEKLSPTMPPFGEALSAQQVRDVVAYIRANFVSSPAAGATATK